MAQLEPLEQAATLQHPVQVVPLRAALLLVVAVTVAAGPEAAVPATVALAAQREPEQTFQR